MSRVVLSEQQYVILETDRATTVRVYVAAAAKRVAVLKEDDLFARADIQANPDKVLSMSDIAKASNLMTSRYVCTWKFVKNETGEMGRTIRLRLVLR
eukprot:5763913-Pyramimonas_sp.AAC.1